MFDWCKEKLESLVAFVEKYFAPVIDAIENAILWLTGGKELKDRLKRTMIVSMIIGSFIMNFILGIFFNVIGIVLGTSVKVAIMTIFNIIMYIFMICTILAVKGHADKIPSPIYNAWRDWSDVTALPTQFVTYYMRLWAIRAIAKRKLAARKSKIALKAIMEYIETRDVVSNLISGHKSTEVVIDYIINDLEAEMSA